MRKLKRFLFQTVNAQAMLGILVGLLTVSVCLATRPLGPATEKSDETTLPAGRRARVEQEMLAGQGKLRKIGRVRMHSDVVANHLNNNW
ncbi:MAG: hypothetical protein WCS65_05220 [Verrucomicrobiae bacterium]